MAALTDEHSVNNNKTRDPGGQSDKWFQLKVVGISGATDPSEAEGFKVFFYPFLSYLTTFCETSLDLEQD